MCATAVPLPPSALPQGPILMRSADRANGWFCYSCPTLGLLPEWLEQFRLSRIEGLEPIQTPARQTGKPARRKPALSSPPAPRPAGEFAAAKTAQNARLQLRSAPRPPQRPETVSSTRSVTAESCASGLLRWPDALPSPVAFRKPAPGEGSRR